MARHRPLSLETLGGEVLTDGEKTVTVPAVSAAQVYEMDFTGQVDVQNRRQIVLVYELWRGDKRVSVGLLPFVPTKHLELADPELTTTVAETSGGFEIGITTKRTARFVWLELDGSDAVFSDNFFDLPARRTATVTLPALEGWTLDRVRESLKVRSLVDSF